MCVGVPAKVIEKYEYTALVNVMGSEMEVGILFVPEVEHEQYVIIHAGQAMTIIDEQFAKESIEEWRRILNERNS